VFPDPGAVAKRWELREFRLGAEGLTPVPVAQEPSRDFDVVPRAVGTGTRSAELGDFLVANADAVRASRFTIPAGWLANSSLVGSGFPAWGNTGSGIVIKDSSGAAVPEDVRHAFALATCAGCHRHETDTRSFLHLGDRRALDPADANDAANLPPAPTPESERQTVISAFLRADIAPGGARHEDYVTLLKTKPADLRDTDGLRACAPR